MLMYINTDFKYTRRKGADIIFNIKRKVYSKLQDTSKGNIILSCSAVSE